jgi:hypothetical protein
MEGSIVSAKRRHAYTALRRTRRFRRVRPETGGLRHAGVAPCGPFQRAKISHTSPLTSCRARRMGAEGSGPRCSAANKRGRRCRPRHLSIQSQSLAGPWGATSRRRRPATRRHTHAAATPGRDTSYPHTSLSTHCDGPVTPLLPSRRPPQALPPTTRGGHRAPAHCNRGSFAHRRRGSPRPPAKGENVAYPGWRRIFERDGPACRGLPEPGQGRPGPTGGLSGRPGKDAPKPTEEVRRRRTRSDRSTVDTAERRCL